MSTSPASETVTQHYQQGDLRRRIDEALDRLYPGGHPLTTDHLRAVDEFHVGGHTVTRLLAEHLELRPGMRVLDAGSGLGARPAIWLSARIPMSLAWI
ncbi:hypothetical protein [Streptomyces phaeochromogenes]|uniref:hypothetical protein n=1 Tax=Streptomyces phaeochromogenes TaxID=1923 RepID=UPI0038631F0A|nr:protein-L-isoaspartate O-methyltransferase [Streptomyces phaeochromogenes]